MFDFFKGVGTKVLIGGVAAAGLFMILSNTGPSSQKEVNKPSTPSNNGNNSSLNGTPKRKCATIKV